MIGVNGGMKLTMSALLCIWLCFCILDTKGDTTKDFQYLIDVMKTRPRLIQLLKSILAERRENMAFKPIDEVIEEASEPGTFSTPSFIPGQDAISIDGDMMVHLEQFSEMQRRTSIDLVEEAMRVWPDKWHRVVESNPQYHWPGVSLQQENGHVRRIRAARGSVQRLWPDGVIPIKIEGNGFTIREKKRMAKGLNQITKATCICFKLINEADAKARIPHVRILEGRGCRSYVGMTIREQNDTLSQDLILGKKCRSSTVFTHEMLHVVGLFHEHSRPDRDEFVDIALENAIPGSYPNFNRISTRYINTRGLPYDYRSIMHYGSRAFSKNGNFTVVPRPDNNRQRYLRRIGRAKRISRRDAAVVNLMYKCSRRRRSRPTCKEFPYTFPK